MTGFLKIVLLQLTLCSLPLTARAELRDGSISQDFAVGQIRDWVTSHQAF